MASDAKKNNDKKGNNKENSGAPNKLYGLARTLLIFAMILFLLYTLAKDNPKVMSIVAEFVKTQKVYDPNEVISIGGQTMGTGFTIKIASVPRGWDGAKLYDLVSPILESVDQTMSTYRNDSSVSIFNNTKSTDWIQVTPETVQIVALAQEISEQTEGAFDITVGPLVDLWRFGPDKTALVEFPSDVLIEETKAKCGWGKLHCQQSPPALKKDHPELRIDLSGIAKGYAVDKVAEALEKKGLNNYLVEVGGEIRCAGSKGENPWRLAIEKPIPTRDAVPQIYHAYRPGTVAMATSGNGRNFSILGKKRFSHIIDPRTGRPTEFLPEDTPRPEFESGSVTIFMQECARADALATALFVLGSDAGTKLANKNGWAVLFVDRSTQVPDIFSDTASQEMGKISETEMKEF